MAATGLLFGIYAANAKKEYFAVAILALFAVGLLLYGVDYAAKKVTLLSRVTQASWLFKAMKWLYGIFETLGLNVLFRPLFNAFEANIGRATLYALLMIYAVAWFALWLGVKVDNFDFFPENSRGKYIMLPSCYENLRPEGKLTIAPSIQSDIIRDPFIRLVIPYDVRYNDSLLARAPSLSEMNPNEPNAEQIELAIKTMSGFYQIALNDSTLSGLEFAFYKFPKTNQPCVITYIPAERLPKGRNVLSVKAASDEWVIPFYRYANRE